MNKTYRFQTIVVSDHARADFTTMRDELGTTDKGLYHAMKTLLCRNDRMMDDLKEIVDAHKAEASNEREAAKLLKLTEKLEKLAAEKAAKLAAKVPAAEVVAEEPAAEEVVPEVVAEPEKKAAAKRVRKPAKKK